MIFNRGPRSLYGGGHRQVVRVPAGPQTRCSEPISAAIKCAEMAQYSSEVQQYAIIRGFPETLERVARLLVGDLRVDLHRDLEVGVPEDLHRHPGWTSRSASRLPQVRRASCTVMCRRPACSQRRSQNRRKLRGSIGVPNLVVITSPFSCHASPASSGRPPVSVAVPSARSHRSAVAAASRLTRRSWYGVVRCPAPCPRAGSASRSPGFRRPGRGHPSRARAARPCAVREPGSGRRRDRAGHHRREPTPGTYEPPTRPTVKPHERTYTVGDRGVQNPEGRAPTGPEHTPADPRPYR